MLLFDGNESFNGMSMQLMRRHDLLISKQALHQKHDKGMANFIKAAFEKVLSIPLPPEEIGGLEIMIKDSTRFALPEIMKTSYPGTKGCGIQAGASVQFEFGIKSGQSSIKLTPANENDQNESHLDKETIQPGVLYMRDLAYTHLSYMRNISQKQAYFINKLNPNTTIYILQDEAYKPLALSELCKMTNLYDHWVYIGQEKMPVRIIIERVNEDLKKSRIADANKYNKKKGHATSKQFKERAGFNFIVTNLPGDAYRPELIQKLYHLRWQIELIFKAWKSSMKVHCLPKGSVERIKCVLYGKLIWAILSWKISMSIGRIGQISILKIHSMIASTKEELRAQLWGLSNRWLSTLAKIPLKRVLKEQRKHRLKIEEIIINI